MDPWDHLRFLAYQEHLKDLQRVAEQGRLASLARSHKPVSRSLLAKVIGYISSQIIKRTSSSRKEILKSPNISCQDCC